MGVRNLLLLLIFRHVKDFDASVRIVFDGYIIYFRCLCLEFIRTNWSSLKKHK